MKLLIIEIDIAKEFHASRAQDVPGTDWGNQLQILTIHFQDI